MVPQSMMPVEVDDVSLPTNWIVMGLRGEPEPTDSCIVTRSNHHHGNCMATRSGKHYPKRKGQTGEDMPVEPSAFSKMLADFESPLAKVVSHAITVAT